MSDSRSPVFARVEFSRGSNKPTATPGDGEAQQHQGEGQKADFFSPSFDAIQSISYKQYIGQSLGDMPYISGAIALHIHKIEELAKVSLAVVGSYGKIRFQFGNEEDQADAPWYECTVTRPSFTLTAEGVSAVIEFHDAAYAKPYTVGSDGKPVLLMSSVVRAASTYQNLALGPGYSTTPPSGGFSPRALRSGEVFEYATGRIIQSRQQYKPHEVFINICDAMGWAYSGVFAKGAAPVPCYEKSEIEITEDVSFHGTNAGELYQWMTDTLCKVSTPNSSDNPLVTYRWLDPPSDLVYRFYFRTDITGKTVACFTTPGFSIEKQHRVSRTGGGDLKTISYGFNVQDSPVINCQIDDNTLTAAFQAASSIVAGDPVSGGTRVTVVGGNAADDSLRGHLPGANIPLAGVTPSHEREMASMLSVAADALRRFNAGIRMTLTLKGTNEYPAGSHFAFRYSLPSGEQFPLVQNCTFEVLEAVHEVSQQGYVTTLSCVSLIVTKAAENPSAAVSVSETPQARQDDPAYLKDMVETARDWDSAEKAAAAVAPKGTVEYKDALETSQRFLRINQRRAIQKEVFSVTPAETTSTYDPTTESYK